MVEIDIPWDDSAVESYGRSFTSWTEDNFKKLTKTLVNTLVATPFAFVVFLVTFFFNICYCPRCTILGRNYNLSTSGSRHRVSQESKIITYLSSVC